VDPSAILLTGKVALVTGAASGIGAATAIALARFGCDVAICDRNSVGLSEVAETIRGHGHRVLPRVLDVRDSEACGDWIAQSADEFGPIEILVNNAGGSFRARFTEMSPNAEAALMAENYGQAAFAIRTALLHWAAEGGSIINVTSIEAHRAAPDFSVYSAAKAALANLSLTLALELADRRIRVNCVAPDVIPAEGLDDGGRAMIIAAENGMAMHPWPLAGSPDDVAAAIVWLSGPMSAFVTGTTIHVDGGTFAAGGWRRAPEGRYVT
jgi:3-oxoacyl-[acyl-carrier protein] reductase